ncbi:MULTISPECIES: succinate dehydrogenase/fumarate reductase iron-sulfur subunit [Natrinema]|uniref:Succinate dehydrogenase and fumarate reductase iron-sulfur protein n=4 Tax=Natrinema TaxID=88723 RepID=L9ZTS9_NATA2|nr:MULTISPECIES: succinate dehydrogenase/fumarate reductase iron-sulfur subunit [Natrinema]ELY74504.1 succinate dehydrogenase and fumarate reductase iron-sulfur protein [Natrinema pallidum DSM 3751]ELY89764.1 succinate dehydrogenase and fumarate reductase iron-sulfur protein [Natrinema altunense JCM 12890]QCW03882.1 succinate dehydrogenase/fumarate reductase iron-sulfur subunit [Natrinema pallidum]RZH67561.1 succinate dehydrogenase/fumarate reductase iron-sulfur subunit [Natrinema altunense]
MSTQQAEPESQEAPEDPAMKGAESPAADEQTGGGMVDDHAEKRAELEGETVHIKVFRYDPEVEGKQEPRFDDFHVPFEKGMTVLDAVMYARDEYDSSLTFRHSCRQAVCGSDAFFVNGKQRLGCKTQISDLEQPVRIEPLPHQEVVKDLVVDMDHFYDQMHTVEPYFQDEDTPATEDLEEQRQTPENREKIKMSSRCIWCGACMSSCNIAAGDNEYLGPAAINKAYKFAMDDREDEQIKEHRLRILEQEHGVWRCQTQFSCTEVCPKDIPLTEHIQELKREAVKKNLKFW